MEPFDFKIVVEHMTGLWAHAERLPPVRLEQYRSVFYRKGLGVSDAKRVFGAISFRSNVMPTPGQVAAKCDEMFPGEQGETKNLSVADMARQALLLIHGKQREREFAVMSDEEAECAYAEANYRAAFKLYADAKGRIRKLDLPRIAVWYWRWQKASLNCGSRSEPIPDIQGVASSATEAGAAAYAEEVMI